MYTQTITVKLDKNTNKILARLAKASKKGKSEVIREAINRFIKDSTSKAGESLVEMSDEAKRYEYRAPKDVVTNHNKYLYGRT